MSMKDIRQIQNAMREKEQEDIKKKLIDVYNYMVEHDYMQMDFDLKSIKTKMKIVLEIEQEVDESRKDGYMYTIGKRNERLQ